jgi:ribosomal protein S12 methylthiotransferase accessory factor YcaO
LSIGSTAGDLALVEAVLKAHGHRPLYVDLTRRDMRLPVVRAIVPGLEVVDGFPAFARVSPRLWANVQALRGSLGDNEVNEKVGELLSFGEQ